MYLTGGLILRDTHSLFLANTTLGLYAYSNLIEQVARFITTISAYILSVEATGCEGSRFKMPCACFTKGPRASEFLAHGLLLQETHSNSDTVQFLPAAF